MFSAAGAGAAAAGAAGAGAAAAAAGAAAAGSDFSIFFTTVGHHDEVSFFCAYLLTGL